ncbi:hypothetical protein [Granulicoccus phenolivorans]|uniref:hypothetical protein n=1 Tax=Granulicoccus phenolivorans TaxID=266854 RepID=UPI00047EA54A|nr:hypothetical protein [Granulicoccus phenolivorans]
MTGAPSMPGECGPERALVLCVCCAVKLVNDDDSGCRDFHPHDHAGLEVPAGTVLGAGPHVWWGARALACDGHRDGAIEPGGLYWDAAVLA